MENILGKEIRFFVETFDQLIFCDFILSTIKTLKLTLTVERTVIIIVLVPVVTQRVDSTIHWITQLILILRTLIGWIVIYPMDSAIHPLNN